MHSVNLQSRSCEISLTVVRRGNHHPSSAKHVTAARYNSKALFLQARLPPLQSSRVESGRPGRGRGWVLLPETVKEHFSLQFSTHATRGLPPAQGRAWPAAPASPAPGLLKGPLGPPSPRPLAFAPASSVPELPPAPVNLVLINTEEVPG